MYAIRSYYGLVARIDERTGINIGRRTAIRRDARQGHAVQRLGHAGSRRPLQRHDTGHLAIGFAGLHQLAIDAHTGGVGIPFPDRRVCVGGSRLV